MLALTLVACAAQSATYTVNDIGDPVSGSAANCAASSVTACTLRDAIAAASGGDTIVFNLPAGSTIITLTHGQLTLSSVTGTVRIDGATATGRVAVDGNHATRVFATDANTITEIRNLTIQNGHVDTNAGGGIYNAGTLTLTRSTLSGNTVTGSGGGIYTSGTATLIDCTVSGNSASSGGVISTSTGGGIANTGQLTLLNSTLSGNGAQTGGGIYNNVGTVTLTNSTLSGNSATSSQGGGIFTFSGTLTLTNSTLSGNGASSGGGIGMTGTTTNISNTIIADGCNNMSSTINDNGGNLDNGTTCGFTAPTSKSNATLNLGLLQANGGATQTMLPGTGSNAINFTDCTNAPLTDQRGYLRPDPVSAALPNPCDAGAVEAGSIPDQIFADGFE